MSRARGRDLPVVLVQGLGCHPRVLGPLAKRIERELRRPTLRPTPWIGLGDVRDVALDLVDAIEAEASFSRIERALVAEGLEAGAAPRLRPAA